MLEGNVALAPQYHIAPSHGGVSNYLHTYTGNYLQDGDETGSAGPAVNDIGGEDSLLEELLELAVALDIVTGGWIFQVNEGGTLESILARVGIAPLEEILRIASNVNGSLLNASQTPRWVSGDHDHLVCAIGERAAGHVMLFLRVRPSPATDRARVEDAAGRIQKLMRTALLTRRPAVAEAPTPTPERSETALSAAAVVDVCPFGVLILDLDQRLQLTNTAAKKLLAEAGVIGQVDDRLVIPNADNALRFQLVLRAVLLARPDKTIQRTIAMVDAKASPILLSIARLPDGPGGARACVIATDPVAGRRIDVQPLAEIFGLTPVETRLVGQLVEGRNVREAAHSLHLKVETARTYLKQIFQKTDTHRQAQLVQLVQGGALPALG